VLKGKDYSFALDATFRVARRRRSLLAGDATMKSRMTLGTKRCEIVFLVTPEQASESNVVYLKILHATTMLASPTIAIQNSPP
jgi:hypothetical protein